MADEYRPRPVNRPKNATMRARLLAIPEGQALVVRDELERRKAAHAFSKADEWKTVTRAQPDGTFIVWLESRGTR